MKYLTKITSNNFQFSCDTRHRRSRSRFRSGGVSAPKSRSRLVGTPPLTLELNILISYLENASKLLKIMKYLTKITNNNFQFSSDTRISPRTAISALFSKPVTRQVPCDTRISPRKSLKQCILAPGKRCDFVQMSWFNVMVHVVVHMSWFMSWFTVVVHVMVHCHGSLSWFNVMVHCHGSLSWFNVMVHCHGSWWFVVVRGSFSLKFSRKYHVTLYLTNQGPRFSIKSHFEWDFVVVRGGS